MGLYLLGITGKVDPMSTLRKFRGQFNNILSVLGKGSHEMNAVHLVKTYCLPTLTYGCENAVFCENTKRKIYVECFRHIFNCCWRKSVKLLHYFCCTLAMSYQIDLNKLLFWNVY